MICLFDFHEDGAVVDVVKNKSGHKIVSGACHPSCHEQVMRNAKELGASECLDFYHVPKSIADHLTPFGPFPELGIEPIDLKEFSSELERKAQEKAREDAKSLGQLPFNMFKHYFDPGDKIGIMPNVFEDYAIRDVVGGLEAFCDGNHHYHKDWTTSKEKIAAGRGTIYGRIGGSYPDRPPLVIMCVLGECTMVLRARDFATSAVNKEFRNEMAAAFVWDTFDGEWVVRSGADEGGWVPHLSKPATMKSLGGLRPLGPHYHTAKNDPTSGGCMLMIAIAGSVATLFFAAALFLN